MRKTILQQHYSWSVQKTAPKNTKYSRNDHFKNPPSRKGYSPCKGYSLCKIDHFWSKLKNAKNMRKTILQQHYSWSVQKTAPKNTKYSRNETFFKIAHPPKAIAHESAIAFAKLVILGQNLKMQKTWEKRFYKKIIVSLCKKLLQKAPNIREMRPFSKSAILQRL